jgi:hypothetical protein
LRRTPSDQRRRALYSFGRCALFGNPARAILREAIIDALAGKVAHNLLGALDSAWRIFQRQTSEAFEHALKRPFVFDNFMHKPKGQSLRGAKRQRRCSQSTRRARADRFNQIGRKHCRHAADTHLWKAEARISARNGPIAGSDEARATAIRFALHQRHRQLRQIVERFQRPSERKKIGFVFVYVPVGLPRRPIMIAAGSEIVPCPA